MNQHYLPQFYLSHFSANDDPKRQGPYLWVFRNAMWSQQAPRSTASAANFYAHKDAAGNVDDRVDQFLKMIETNVAPILARLASSPPNALSDDDRLWLSFFIVTMRVRVPGYIDSFAAGIDQSYKQVHWLLYQQFKENPDTFQRAKEKLRTEKNLDLPDMTVEDLHPDKYKVDVPNAYVVTMAVQQLTKLAELIYRMNWTMYTIDSPGFVTSDYPVVSLTPGAANRLLSGGWGDPGVEITFPLTAKLGLLCTWKESPAFSLQRPTIEQLRTMNLRTIDSATDSMIIAPSKVFPGSDIIDKAILDSATAAAIT